MMNTADYLQVIDETIKNGPYKANWASLSAVSHYITFDMGPGRDILGELKAAFAE